MRIKTCIACVLIVIGGCACSSDHLFDVTPTERTEQKISELHNELLSAQYGWKVIYFPQTDSLLFSDPGAKIGQYDYEPSKFSYGGKYFLMRFTDNGNVEMYSDDNLKSTETPIVSEYKVDYNSMVQLSFTTYNYIHSLVNDAFGGSSDFLYAGNDHLGRMRFKTLAYLNPAREYIVFEKLEKDPKEADMLRRAFENRTFFENMKNPQIRISKGERTFFQSDRYLKHSQSSTTISSWEKGSREHRYYVFLYNRKLNPIPDTYPLEVNGLGSGYVGTEDGLWFRSGIRYSQDIVFYNFYREGKKLISELVKVYDPVTRQFFYGDKQMYPEGEFTGYQAVIEDKPIVK